MAVQEALRGLGSDSDEDDAEGVVAANSSTTVVGDLENGQGSERQSSASEGSELGGTAAKARLGGIEQGVEKVVAASTSIAGDVENEIEHDRKRRSSDGEGAEGARKAAKTNPNASPQGAGAAVSENEGTTGDGGKEIDGVSTGNGGEVPKIVGQAQDQEAVTSGIISGNGKETQTPDSSKETKAPGSQATAKPKSKKGQSKSKKNANAFKRPRGPFSYKLWTPAQQQEYSAEVVAQKRKHMVRSDNLPADAPVDAMANEFLLDDPWGFKVTS